MANNTRIPADIIAKVVVAYISKTAVPAAELSPLIFAVYGAFNELGEGKANTSKIKAAPAVPINKSITADYIICLEDGKQFKSLKRYLRTCFNMTPQEYRARWGLPHDYPMVAPAYARARSTIAKQTGFGLQRPKIRPTIDKIAEN